MSQWWQVLCVEAPQRLEHDQLRSESLRITYSRAELSNLLYSSQTQPQSLHYRIMAGTAEHVSDGSPQVHILQLVLE